MGPHVCRELVSLGHSVTVFHRGKTVASLPEGVNTVRGDRQQLGRHIDELRAVKADVVIDMIAFTTADTKDLLEVFGGHVPRAVVASSCDVYRNFGGLIGVETLPPEMGALTEESAVRSKRYPFRAQAKGRSDWAYEYEKLDVEELLERSKELPSSVIRLPMVYGEGDYRRRTSPYLKQAKEKGKVIMGETHAAWRTHRGYVENMAHGIVLAAVNPVSAGRTYNVADATSQSELEFAKMILKSVGMDVPVEVVPDPKLATEDRFPGDPHYPLELDTTRIRTELGHTDVVPLEESISRTAKWELSTLK